MPGVQFTPSRAHRGPFTRGNPIGLVLHRTEEKWADTLRDFQAGPVTSHFLIGKQEGQIVQLVDTSQSAMHVGSASSLYLGIEFESITGRKHVRGGQDPRVILDDLTPFQASIGCDVVDWICRNHAIPKVGPPSPAEWRNCLGHWHGVLGHDNLWQRGFFYAIKRGRRVSEDHGDTLQFLDFISLGVWPSPGLGWSGRSAMHN